MLRVTSRIEETEDNRLWREIRTWYLLWIIPIIKTEKVWEYEPAKE